jgi:hypothetical protein
MAEDRCGGCVFLYLPKEYEDRTLDDYDEFTCRRYPKTERKRLCDWCGEFRSKIPNPYRDTVDQAPPPSKHDAREVLAKARSIASGWDTDVKVVGDLSAGDIVQAIDAVIGQSGARQAARENRGTTIDDILSQVVVNAETIAEEAEQVFSNMRSPSIAPVVPRDVLRFAPVGEEVATNSFPGVISARYKDGYVDVLFRDFDVTFRYRVP